MNLVHNYTKHDRIQAVPVMHVVRYQENIRGVAQLVEYSHGVRAVSSSSLLTPTKWKIWNAIVFDNLIVGHNGMTGQFPIGHFIFLTKKLLASWIPSPKVRSSMLGVVLEFYSTSFLLSIAI